MKKLLLLLLPLEVFAARLPGGALPQGGELPRAMKKQATAAEGVVDGVDIPHSTITVYHNALTFDSRKLKVYRKGSEVGVYDLKPGQKIRYMLDSSGKKVLRIWIGE